MRRPIDWVIVALAVVLVIGLMAYARGRPHYRGDEIGSHGEDVVVVRIVP